MDSRFAGKPGLKATRKQARVISIPAACHPPFRAPCAVTRKNVKGRGSAKAPHSCGRRFPQGLCSLKEEEFRTSEKGVPVLGVIKCGVIYDTAR